ncbi:hypothetical protein EU527_09515 [Candidatus Thorarchaeota archaeon]|nr:MAG: hypothetical protein EU527_09515 [Candidatus Thorarchaeota archaeon]
MKPTQYIRIFIVLSIICSILPASNTAFNDNIIRYQQTVFTHHEIVIDSLSWKAFSIDCHKGEIISGSFEVHCDGSLYPGDEQKYDDWISEGIQFYILNLTSYLQFIEGHAFNKSYCKYDVSKLSWSFQIPDNGKWYIIYYNNSIYMMTVIGAINAQDTQIQLFVFIVGMILIIPIALSLFYIAYKKKEVRKLWLVPLLSSITLVH